MPSASSKAEYLTGLHPLPDALWTLIHPSVNHASTTAGGEIQKTLEQ